MDCYAHRHRKLSSAIRRGLTRCAGYGLGVAILLGSSVGWAASYRWVDEKGHVHYSDLPPGNSTRGYTELSTQGRVLRQFDSAEVRARRAAESKRLAEEARTKRERELQDKALLATYRSAADIDLAKQHALTIEQELLDNLLARRKLCQTRGEAAYLDGQILQRRESAQKVSARFDADKLRYIELTEKH